MKSTLLFLPAAVLLCTAATTNNYGSLRDETPPTWLPVPVAGVRASQLHDTWGAARSDGRTHEGIDIMAPRGTPVLSATHGVVSAVQWRELGGNTVSVLGPGGYSHYYAHLASYGRHVAGEWVDVGDTLGYVGNTGNAQGGPTHLHYGIYTESGAINPYPFLVARSAKATPPVKAKPSQGSTPRRDAKSGSPAKQRTNRVPVVDRNPMAVAPQIYTSRARR
jgi:murein DD-endopeptidase MepM/ murein hydrolase activator NlpD